MFRCGVNSWPCHVDPSHHGLAPLWVADGGDSLHIWKVATNILNNQSRRAAEGWSSSLGFGQGLTPPDRKIHFVRKRYTGPRTLTNSF
jgi:hypothetical protein